MNRVSIPLFRYVTGPKNTCIALLVISIWQSLLVSQHAIAIGVMNSATRIVTVIVRVLVLFFLSFPSIQP